PIDDRIVLFAIAQLIAPCLDKKLPPNVYSWRVRKNWKGGELFHDHKLLKFPFLKRRTIVREIDFIEPWYGVWPRFVSDAQYAYEEEGYSSYCQTSSRILRISIFRYFETC